MTDAFWDSFSSRLNIAEMADGLRIRSVLRSIANITSPRTPANINWRALLFAASMIDGTAPKDLLEVRLQICLEALQNEDSPSAAKRGAAILLQRSGNERTVDLALTRGLISEEEVEPPVSTVGLEAVKSSLAHGIPTSHGLIIQASDFQARFWDAATEASWVSASAPTSAGKSYIVREFIRDRFSENERFAAAFIVPTRALVEEVSRDLLETLPSNTAVITLPWTASPQSERQVYVMTQERLHALQQINSALKLDLIFVDEAQNIAGGRRGVLLRRVIEESRRRNDIVDVIFASPTTENPEVLLIGGNEDGRAIHSSDAAVGQNLIFVNQVPYHPLDWTVDAFSMNRRIPVGEIRLDARPTTVGKRLPLVALAMGKASTSNIVYADGPADAEKIALQLAEALGQRSQIPSELLDIQELSENSIHPEYALSECIRRGVAFHYGNMPVLLRESIEAAFRSGAVRYLVCTSTLLEGVNLPCQNIFIRAPHKGPNQPMTEADFWNLAGRAGRWGREFQGNIICVDTDRPAVWRTIPGEKKLHHITFATDMVRQNVEDFLSAVDGEQVEESETMESIVSLALAARSLGTDIEESAWLRLTPPEQIEVRQHLDRRLGALTIPALLVARHAGVSPRRLENLFAALRDREDLDSLDLTLPESFEASRRLTTALGFVGAFLGGTIGSNTGRHVQLAIMLVQWMRGVPLAVLIKSRVDFIRRRDGAQANVPSAIRSVMKDIEQIARFEAPLLLGAYRDVLSLARTGAPLEVTGTNQDDFVAMLELGVSRMTEFSMLSLGLSRTAAVALSEYLSSDQMSPSEVDTWLASRNLDTLAIPALIREELSRYMSRKSERLL
jgi:hypothetical protein